MKCFFRYKREISKLHYHIFLIAYYQGVINDLHNIYIVFYKNNIPNSIDKLYKKPFSKHLYR